MKRSRRPLLVAFILVAGGFASLYRSPAPQSPAHRRDAAEGSELHKVEVAAPGRREAIIEGLGSGSRAEVAARSEAMSLRGTDVDGALPVDSDGHLIVSPVVRRFFDYFFVTSGERAPAEIRAAIVAAIEARLNEPARWEALELLDRYIDYRESGRQVVQEGNVADDVDDRLEQIRELRRANLGERNADALFVDDEARDYVALAERQIASDPSLSEDDRAARLEELEARLPDAERATRAAATGPLRLARDEATLRSFGASPDEIRALREERFGSEAADRLADLDRRRAEWQQRVDDYRRERHAIEQDSTLSGTEHERLVGRLLAEHFDETEQLRVRALDRIRADSASDGGLN